MNPAGPNPAKLYTFGQTSPLAITYYFIQISLVSFGGGHGTFRRLDAEIN
jgi:hypothetical protein